MATPAGRGAGAAEPHVYNTKWDGAPETPPFLWHHTQPGRPRGTPVPIFPFQVKYSPDDLLNGSEWDGLSQEVWDEFMTTQQTEDIFRKKMCLWRRLYVAVKGLVPHGALLVVGSTVSGFALADSDLDVVLLTGAPPSRPRALAVLGALRDALGGRGDLIAARVPILRLADARTGLVADVGVDARAGPRNTRVLRALAAGDWRARPLVAAAKLWARAHRLLDARHGDLSSFALTLTVLAFLRGAGRGGALGELFARWLGWFAGFPWRAAAVSLGGAVPARAPGALLPRVEEPCDRSNAASSVRDERRFARALAVFRAAHDRLLTTRRLRDAWPT